MRLGRLVCAERAPIGERRRRHLDLYDLGTQPHQRVQRLTNRVTHCRLDALRCVATIDTKPDAADVLVQDTEDGLNGLGAC